jgi:hypothetical protein
METPEQRSARFAAIREDVACKLLEKYPNINLERDKYGIDVIYYVASFYDGGIHISKRKKGINTTVFNLDSYFLTEESAKQAITKYIDDAKIKFEKCLRSLNKLQESLGFDVSYCVYGDTHGIEDYPYISFKIGGFDFTFRIDD